jgi:hypothetical protein
MAMAAPTALPEFKGNVVAVLTEKYWDMELVELRARDAKIKQKVRELLEEGKLSREQQNAALERYRAEVFNPRQMVILEKGASNLEFHYLGSAKIMAQIGKGFAEALVEMIKRRSHE